MNSESTTEGIPGVTGARHCQRYWNLFPWVFISTNSLFKILTQSIYDSLMKLIITLKLSLCGKFTREKMRYTERKSLAIFQLCDTPGFL